MQLLAQVNRAMKIFQKVHPECIVLFLFNHSSTHTSLGPDALHAFEMNKGNGGKQRKQKDTVIPINNPTVECCRKPQKMTTEVGKPKGLQQMLKKQRFNIHGMYLKCSPVCLFENNNCCMAWLLSKQDDFRNQISLLKQKIHTYSHIYVFLPKFHCKLNPIEMVVKTVFILIPSTEYS